MELNEILKRKREKILSLGAKHGVVAIRIFGSVARGNTRPTSDIDFLVKIQRGRSLFDLGGFCSDLEKLLGRPIDVVTEKGLRERIRSRVMRESIPL